MARRDRGSLTRKDFKGINTSSDSGIGIASKEVEELRALLIDIRKEEVIAKDVLKN